MEKNGSEFSDRLLQFRATYKVFGEKKVFGYFLTFCRRPSELKNLDPTGGGTS